MSAAVASIAAALLYAGLPDAAVPDAPVGPPRAGPDLPTATAGPLDSLRFGEAGCVAFGPTVGDRDRTVFLDPGHGAPDPGASGVTASGEDIDEKDLNLSVALDTAAELRARGYRVALSRTTDALGLRLAPDDLTAGALSSAGTRAQLAARAQCANFADADALVSIHFNSFDDPEVRGAETLYEPERPFAADNRRLATLLQRNILTGYRDLGRLVPDRGAIGGSGAAEQVAPGADDLLILGPADPGSIDEPSSMPGALIEPLFITNPADASLATSPPGRQALARAITTGVDEFLQQP